MSREGTGGPWFGSELRRLPEHVEVFTARIGWSEGRAQAGFFRVNSIARVDSEHGAEPDRYLLTFSALDFGVQVFRSYWDEAVEFVGRASLSVVAARVWPPGESFTWPPGPALTQRGLEVWAGDPL